MVLIGQAIRQGFRLAGKIDKKYNLNKIFVDKYVPPGYRKTAYRLIDIAGIGGMVISSAFYLLDEPNAKIRPQKLQQETYSQYQKDSRFSRGSGSRYSKANYSRKQSRQSCINRCKHSKPWM